MFHTDLIWYIPLYGKFPYSSPVHTIQLHEIKLWRKVRKLIFKNRDLNSVSNLGLHLDEQQMGWTKPAAWQMDMVA
jgi:hypothetical protein